MRVTVNDIIELGSIVGGKFPDIYWDVEGITGTELRVINYVFENCVRLYTTLKVYPKGKDGSPRFWRGKEAMADDCGLSYPTFRKNVRHLYELGILTSMDGIEDEDEPYCIGLSAEYVNNIFSMQNEKVFRLPTLNNLLQLIYNQNTIRLVNCNLNSKVVLQSSDTKVSELQEQESTDVIQEHIEPKRVPIILHIRQAIKVGRKAITSVPYNFILQSSKEKLKALQGVITLQDKEVLKVCEYYEYKCRQAIHSSGFRALGKDWKNSKNWIYLERLYKLCKDNNWDYKVYIDSQFERVHYWNRKQKYPYLNQFFSENAIRCYNNYIKDMQESYSILGTTKVKSKEVKSVNNQIIDDVINDCDKIASYIQVAQRRRSTKELSLEELKMVYLSDHWTGLSVYYLAGIPWFLQYLNQFPDEGTIKSLKEDISSIQNSKSMLKRVTKIIGDVESQMNIPKTMVM